MKRDEMIELLQDVFNSSPSVGIIKLQRVLAWLERLPAGCELVGFNGAVLDVNIPRGKSIHVPVFIQNPDDITKAGKR